MRIDGITSCSGEQYANLLCKALPKWLDTLDSITIVCKPDDAEVISLQRSNVRVVTTNIFTEHGAYFNKGAALNCAYAAANPSDWILHFDADITPPDNWRRQAESKLQFGHLHGCARYVYRSTTGNKGFKTIRKQSFPVGFFQLWNSNDPVSLGWPLFDPNYIHCGRSDYLFADRWGIHKWKSLPIIVDHFGPTYTNWFGPEEQEMMRIFKGKNPKIRLSQLSDFTLKIPEPSLRLCIQPGEREWIQQVLRICRKADLFQIKVVTRLSLETPTPEGFTELTPENSLDELEQLIEGRKK